MNRSQQVLLVIWTWKENRILKAKWTLFGNESLECFISQVTILFFIFLKPLHTWLRIVSLRCAAALWCLFLLWRVTWNLEWFKIILLRRYIKITKNVALHRLERISSVSILTEIHRSGSLGLLLLGSGLLLRLLDGLLLRGLLNVFEILEELLVFYWIEDVLLVLEIVWVECFWYFERCNWSIGVLLLGDEGRKRWFESLLLGVLLELLVDWRNLCVWEGVWDWWLLILLLLVLLNCFWRTWTNWVIGGATSCQSTVGHRVFSSSWFCEIIDKMPWWKKIWLRSLLVSSQ